MAIRIIVILLFLLRLSLTTDGQSQDQPPTPAELYKALLKQHQLASSSGGVLTDEQRMQYIGKVYKQRNQIGQKEAEKN